MTQPGQRWLLVAVLVMLNACASLPEYAAPKLVAIEDIDTDREDSIPYRLLQRSDFRGERPPGSFDERMAAVTCAFIEPLIDPEALEIEQGAMSDGAPSFRITLHNLKYRALMDRACSWWNPAVDDQREDYILAHEQIHFALFEVAARDWSDAPPLKFNFRAENQDDVVEKIRIKFKQQFDEKMETLMRQNRDFDEQTSVGYDPLKQQVWAERVRQLLEESAETGRAIAAAAFLRQQQQEEETE